MKDVSGQGRTVLFVSHNMAAVRNLCDKAVLLNRGVIDSFDTTDVVLDRYLSSQESQSLSGKYYASTTENKDLFLIEAVLRDNNGLERDSFEIIEDVFVFLNIRCNKQIPNLYGYIVVKNGNDEILIESDTLDVIPNSMESVKVGENLFRLKIDRNVLGVGDYLIYLSFASSYSDQFSVDVPGEILKFSITDSITQRGHHRRSFTSQILKWEPQ
jgi:lipopolysaccharide transport system ATP-binding protein